MPILENVTLFYTKIQQPGQNFDKTATEYSVDACVSKDVAKEWSKAHPKQKAKAIDNDEFEEKYRTPPPFPGQESQHMIKIKKKTHYIDRTTGESLPIPDNARPRVYDSERNDITDTTLVGNGSKGAVAYEVFENKYGQFANLKAVRVDNLVEYTGGSSSGADELFGSKPKPTAASGAKPRRATPPPVEDNDSPFG